MITYYSSFLTSDRNSSEEFVKRNKLPAKELPVLYSSAKLKRLIKRKPDRLIMLGMHEDIKHPRFETLAHNRRIHLKSPFKRFVVECYARLLWLFTRNLHVNKLPAKDSLIIIPIDAGPKARVNPTTPPKTFAHGDDAGHFICNYHLYKAIEYVKRYSPKTKIYFLHLPERLKKEDEKRLMKFLKK